mmetsp:Transcript_19145/g.63285  ORF Transcript_19145/g.63285 Transcript_19145/m.63285 type:complete len:136 (-) Transcript_19145:71-478(-)
MCAGLYGWFGLLTVRPETLHGLSALLQRSVTSSFPGLWLDQLRVRSSSITSRSPRPEVLRDSALEKKRSIARSIHGCAAEHEPSPFMSGTLLAPVAILGVSARLVLAGGGDRLGELDGARYGAARRGGGSLGKAG